MAIRLSRRFSVPASDSEALAKLTTASKEALGGLGEAIWANVLRASGWLYIPLAQIENGGAPCGIDANGYTVLPDFDAKNQGDSIYLDAKVKTQSIRYRLARNQERHGINQSAYLSYRRMEDAAGQRCCLGIVELQQQEESGGLAWSGSLLMETLANLGQPRCENPERPPKVYWPRKRFVDLDSFSPRELFQLATGELTRSYAYEIDRIVRPMTQSSLF